MNHKRLLSVMLALVTGIMSSGEVVAQTPIRYPIILKDYERLIAVGISFDDGSGKAGLPHKCYYYGDAGYHLSISDALLNRYKSRGFSLESLCMALVSQARFDPETGRRLPTYIVIPVKQVNEVLAAITVDDSKKMQILKGRNAESLTAAELKLCCGELRFITEELPLVPPPCFKNANPYSDCAWRYAIRTGERLSARSVEKFRRLGLAIESKMQHAISTKPRCAPNENIGWPCTLPKRHSDEGYLATAGTFFVEMLNGAEYARLYPGQSAIPAALLKGQNATFFALSPSFPRGFGYALYAEGGAGPDYTNWSLGEVVGADDPKTQIDDASLQRAAEE